VPEKDGRTIQIACMRDRAFLLEDMPFHNQMTVPCSLSLRSIRPAKSEAAPNYVRLFRWPVAEIEKLRHDTRRWQHRELPAGKPFAVTDGRLFDIETTIEPGSADQLMFSIRGVPIVYDVPAERLSFNGVDAPLELGRDGVIELRILVDQASCEIFADRGRRVRQSPR